MSPLLQKRDDYTLHKPVGAFYWTTRVDDFDAFRLCRCDFQVRFPDARVEIGVFNIETVPFVLCS